MNQYLARFALRNMRLGLNNTWVLSVLNDEKPDDKAEIAAYFTLATSTVTREEIPTDKKLPGYSVPAHCLILDVLDEDALTYYQRFEMFTSFTDDPMRLFVPIHVVKKI